MLPSTISRRTEAAVDDGYQARSRKRFSYGRPPSLT